MAIGPSLVYVDQVKSMVFKKDATGFSRDTCAILLIANIMRCFFWLGNRFEVALLIQSILMILTQSALLYVCLLYNPPVSRELSGTSARPFRFWQWSTFTQYIEFLAGFILCQIILFLVLGRADIFINLLGFAALGLESTLPIPQLLTNQKQRSLHGFRMTTLAGWVAGDTYKTLYFFLQHSPLQFKICAIFQLTTDCIIVLQRLRYGNAPPAVTAATDEAELEEALVLAS